MCKKNYATKLCAVMTAMSIVLSGCAQSTGTDVNDNSSSTSENQITEEANNKIAEDIEAEADDIIDSEDVEESSLTPTQRNSVNMLNYMSALTQEPAALHVYFDLFSGAIQTYVFCMLTMTYVADAIGDN